MPLGVSPVRDRLVVEVVQRVLCVKTRHFFGSKRFRRLTNHDSCAVFRFR